MTEPTDALMPCPFCGEAAKHSFNSLYGDMSMASCKSCGATAYAPKWNRRAVLAKWGTPVGAGEPFGYFHQLLNHEGKGNGVWLGAAERKVVEQAHTPGETSEEIVALYTTPQPTQAQAGAVTDAQVLSAVRVVSPGLFRHGLQPLPNDGANTAARMRKEADTVRKMLEAANGIKGGQHEPKQMG